MSHRKHCSTCQHRDGSLDTAVMDAEGSCTFGCGSIIQHDEGGICPDCKDHSANRFECPECHNVYEDWNDKWALVEGPATVGV